VVHGAGRADGTGQATWPGLQQRVRLGASGPRVAGEFSAPQSYPGLTAVTGVNPSEALNHNPRARFSAGAVGRGADGGGEFCVMSEPAKPLRGLVAGQGWESGAGGWLSDLVVGGYCPPVLNVDMRSGPPATWALRLADSRVAVATVRTVPAPHVRSSLRPLTHRYPHA
jgi:hypothetical protein